MNIFDFMYDTFHFEQEEITLIELFAGIGSQAMSLKMLSKEHNFTLKTLGISEIDKYAIKSYNAIHGETHNFGNIKDIKELPYCDIMTYSFPCQDISLAGKGKGFAKGSGTRSGLLWEVERILETQKELNKLPQVLLMENVKALAQTKFVDDFNMWQLKLQELGYTSYWEILNAKNYGIPQNRERVFMVSILGEYNYTFPKPFELKFRLKDMLEDEVDEKYYLSDKMIKFFQENTIKQKERGNGFEFKPQKGEKVARSITTNAGSRMDDNFIKQVGKLDIKGQEHTKRILSAEGISPTITTMSGGNHEPKIIIPEATKKGYTEATEGDGVYINRPHQKRGVVQKGMTPTIKTSGDDIGVVDNMKIRKLTPKECWRLMGFTDEQFEKAQKVCSNSQLYKQAGNSIVVDVLYYIFKQLFTKK